MAIIRYAQIIVIDTQANLFGTSALKGDLAYALDSGLAFTFDGSYWNPSSKVQVKKSSVAVNAKNTGSTLLYTLEQSSLNFYPTQIVPRPSGVGVSGVTTGPTMSIGTNSTSYNNIASSSMLGTVLATLSGGNSLALTTYSPALAGGSTIYANVSIGSIATNYTELFDILGFYDV